MPKKSNNVIKKKTLVSEHTSIISLSSLSLSNQILSSRSGIKLQNSLIIPEVASTKIGSGYFRWKSNQHVSNSYGSNFFRTSEKTPGSLVNLNKDNRERGPGTYIVNKFLRRVLYTQKRGLESCYILINKCIYLNIYFKQGMSKV